MSGWSYFWAFGHHFLNSSPSLESRSTLNVIFSDTLAAEVKDCIA